MGNDREEWISRRAYELWEQVGQPEGQADEHWAKASAEWDAGPDATDADCTPWFEEE